jgi:hypothetical protein
LETYVALARDLLNLHFVVGDFSLELIALVLQLLTDRVVLLYHLDHLIFEVCKPAQVLGLLAA